ncbi:hypothetical protein GWI33_002612, partial [Rhynchophorus ferrugineus]
TATFGGGAAPKKPKHFPTRLPFQFSPTSNATATPPPVSQPSPDHPNYRIPPSHRKNRNGSPRETYASSLDSGNSTPSGSPAAVASKKTASTSSVFHSSPRLPYYFHIRRLRCEG